MPTVQTTDDFNHAIDAGYYTAAFWGSPSSVASPLYQSQPKSLKVPATSGVNTGVRTNITGSPARGWMAWALRLETLPTVSDIRVGNLEESNGGEARFAVSTAGSLYCYIGGGSTVSYSGNPLVADTWYWLEAILDAQDGTGVQKLYWRVNDVAQTTATVAGPSGTGKHGQMYSGSGDGTADYYVGIWKLGSAASVSDWLGTPVSGQVLLPDADVTTTGWTTAPLFSKLNDASDATIVTATAA